jgi:hypothetical protein
MRFLRSGVDFSEGKNGNAGGEKECWGVGREKFGEVSLQAHLLSCQIIINIFIPPTNHKLYSIKKKPKVILIPS